MFEVKVTPSAGEARAELELVLASTLFVRSPRLSRLLQYLCTKYFEGATEEVKEYQIGVEVLGRPATFDPAEDAAARVEAHRLRKRLREFYETEGRSHTLRIEVPLGHYAVAFRPITAEPPTEAGQDEVRSGPVPVLENGSANGSSSEVIGPPRAGRLNFRIWWRILPLVILAGVAIAMLARHPAVSNPPAAPLSKSQIAATGEPPAAENARLTGLAAGGSVRIA